MQDELAYFYIRLRFKIKSNSIQKDQTGNKGNDLIIYELIYKIFSVARKIP